MGTLEDGHVATLQEVYRRWRESRGADTKAWFDVLGRSIAFRSLGASTPLIDFSRNGMSRDDVERYFADLARDWEMLDFTVDHMIAQGDRVAVLADCSWRNRHTGKVVKTMKADVFRFEGGHIVEFAELFDTAGAVEAATP